MKKIDYLPQFKGFGIADADFNQLIKEELPVLTLGPKDFGIAPEKKTALIGVLFGREEDNYCLAEDYVHSLINAGAKIMFWTISTICTNSHFVMVCCCPVEDSHYLNGISVMQKTLRKIIRVTEQELMPSVLGMPLTQKSRFWEFVPACR